MAKQKMNQQKQAVNTVFMSLSLLAAFLMIAVGILGLWAHNFTNDMVKSELSAQKIYFPPKDSPAFDPAMYPDLQQYAGQLVDTPDKAKAYANGFIGRHLKEVANGKVYAEVSAEAMKDPTNQKLEQQKQTLFQGETLRGLLLTSGYGFGTMGKIAGVVAYVAFGLSLVFLLLTAFFRARI